MKPVAIKTMTVLGMLMMPAGSALASSPQAWEDFEKDVKAACIDAGQDIFKRPRAIVDPVGSTSFGLAILFGKSAATDERISMICVYDKQSRSVEIGSELGTDLVRVRRPGGKNRKNNQDNGQQTTQEDDQSDDMMDDGQ